MVHTYYNINIISSYHGRSYIAWFVGDGGAVEHSFHAISYQNNIKKKTNFFL